MSSVGQKILSPHYILNPTNKTSLLLFSNGIDLFVSYSTSVKHRPESEIRNNLKSV